MAYRKFYWIIFPETFIFEVPSWMVRACKKSRLVTEQNFELETNVFRRFYFRFAQFQATFNFRCADFPWLPHVIDLENSHYFLTQSDSKFGGVPSQLLVNTHQQMMVFWVVSF